MIRALLLLAFCGACSVAGAAEIKTYDTRLDVAPDGSAQARVDVQLTGAQAGRLRLPVGVAALDGFQALGIPAGVTIKPMPAKDQSSIEIELPENVSPDLKFGFTFKVPGVLFEPRPEEGQKPTFPEGTRLFRHGFVNTQPTPIAQYRVEVRLPQQTMVQKIREQLPRPKRKEFVPRVELDRFDGQQGALLQLTGLKQGDRTSMELEIVSDRRSYLWLVAGLALAVAYLFAFRDVVKPGSR
jgi:hypothetical protein